MKSRVIVGLLTVAVCVPAWTNMRSQKTTNLRFETFAVPGTPTGIGVLGVEDINDLFEVTGYVQVQSGVRYFGWQRNINGKITTLNNPLSTTPAPYTYAASVNNWGTVAGYFWNSAASQFSGFFLRNGNYQTYNVPGLPAFSDTTIYSLNDFGDFCGFYEEPPNYALVPYASIRGKIVTDFNILGSTGTYPEWINDRGEIVGAWYDGAGTAHGFIREPGGAIRTYDAPGAGPMGTALLGLNVRGWMSGHYWDAQNHEHGFAVSPRGKFYSFDVPGAAENLNGGGTAGGVINDEGVLAGHYDPADGSPDRGYLVLIPSNWR